MVSEVSGMSNCERLDRVKRYGQMNRGAWVLSVPGRAEQENQKQSI